MDRRAAIPSRLTVATLVQIESADRQLLTEMAGTMAEAARRSGEWLACHIGCTQCCIGPFGITQLDALRLRRGMEELERVDLVRAAAVRARADAYVERIAAIYPGDARTGELFEEDDLPESMDELPCPALDPATGACELYDARPITCRSFGPATRIGDDRLAACELCYVGATDAEIATCAVELDADGIEAGLVEALQARGVKGMTIVAYAVAHAL
jgi:Fe-S-cluster containining protein